MAMTPNRTADTAIPHQSNASRRNNASFSSGVDADGGGKGCVRRSGSAWLDDFRILGSIEAVSDDWFQIHPGPTSSEVASVLFQNDPLQRTFRQATQAAREDGMELNENEGEVRLSQSALPVASPTSSASGLVQGEAACTTTKHLRKATQSAPSKVSTTLSLQEQLSETPAKSKNSVTTCDNDLRTTLMLRNLPTNYTRSSVATMIDSLGFAGMYDFLYVPIDFKTCGGRGYAFVNMVNASVASQLMIAFQGYSKWSIPSRKRGQGVWSDCQGLQENVHRLRDSPIMHTSVPEDFKPLLLQDGVPVPFPKPTCIINPPRWGV
eukprot:TRINITY_DN18451_c0_g1_i1.p1 TRINITY_DN18451_c0_g1~~TRINITY_DN18451_c0_g1_i1.p1  ORF type:complete len:322 (+),score=35.43 TRINITY_DN18451_c0_g1_i1:234-1199(+)